MKQIFSQNCKKHIILIWFASTIEITEDIKETMDDLQRLNDCVFFFNKIDPCIDFIKSLKKEKIFLIISAENIYQSLPNILHLSQLDSIFVYPANRAYYSRLFDDFHKTVNIFNNLDELKISIKENIEHFNQQVDLFSFYDLHQQSLWDISAQSAEFLWFQIFKHVINCLPPNEKAKEDMLNACRQYHRGNHRQLTIIDEFDQTYHPDDCIRWYTGDTFVYQLINKALRTKDIVQLYLFRFYISDLSKQLAEEHKRMRNQSEEMIRLYRGAIIPIQEIETIRKSQVKLLATNCYWSTSHDQSYAMTFAKKYNNRTDMTRVLFQIECHFNDEIIFADISNFSHFPAEKEVLFDLGATFTIQQIHEETIDGIILTKITLKTNREGREVSQKYLEENRKQMKFESPTILLCNLLKRMGKFQESFSFLEYLLENPGNENLAHIHNRLGIALKDDRKYRLAFDHFKKALQLTRSLDSSQQKYLPVILLNQGLLHAKIKQFHQALYLYKQAQKLLKNESYYDPYVLAHLYTSVGRVYSHQGYFNKAIHYHFEALVLDEEILPAGHQFIAMCYTDIAYVYLRQKDYQKALKYHLKALDLRKNNLPANHYHIAWSLHQIGRLYQQMHHIQSALQYYLESLEINRQWQSNSLSNSIVHLFDDIISIYGQRSNLSLEYQLQALNIQKQIEPINYFNLTSCLDKIASTYLSINNLNESHNYYQEALEIREKYLSNDSRNLARNFYNLGFVYEKMERKNDALTFYEKEVIIFTDIHPFNRSLYQRAKTNVRRIRRLLESDFNRNKN